MPAKLQAKLIHLQLLVPAWPLEAEAAPPLARQHSWGAAGLAAVAAGVHPLPVWEEAGEVGVPRRPAWLAAVAAEAALQPAWCHP